jgi:UPF0716 protein FxsA
MRVLFIFIIIILLDLFATLSLESYIGHNASITLNYVSGLVGLILVRKGFLRHVIEVFKKLKNKQKILNDGWEALAFFISGLLFLTPGIITDIVGAVLLIPLARIILIDKILKPTFKKDK